MSDRRELAGCTPLILVGYLTAGGSERQAYLLSRALQDAGFRPGVIVWTLTPGDCLGGLIEQRGIPLAFAPQTAGSFSKVGWLRGIVRECCPSLIHSMAFFLNCAAWWAMRDRGIAIGSIRGDYRYERQVGRIHYALNRHWPASVIANSQLAWQQAKQDSSPFRVRNPLWVPNGLDVTEYVPRIHRERGFVRVIGVGNLYRSKRWDRLVRAAAEIARASCTSPFEVLIAGEGEERGNLEALIAETNMESTVKLIGRRFDVPDLLANSDIFVFTSETEGSPNAVMEAMAAGLPVITSNAGDAPRLVSDGETGFVIAHNDLSSLVAPLMRLIADTDLRAHMGEAGRKRAEMDFSLEMLAQRTVAAYRQAGWTGD
jgi:glycosyltransferase involved in cell wall biosynthesis